MNISLIKVLGKWVSVFIATSITLSNNQVDTIPVVEVKEKEELPIIQNTNYEINNNEEMIEEQKEEEYNVIETFNGTITGYGPDCVGCSGEGYLACRTENGSKFSLKYDGVYYIDSTYGEVQILAAAHTKFPCGTIIEVDRDGNKFLGIVLDTGGTMRKAWNERNEVWIDVAYSTEHEAEQAMPYSKNITYNILRYGWK